MPLQLDAIQTFLWGKREPKASEREGFEGTQFAEERRNRCDSLTRRFHTKCNATKPLASMEGVQLREMTYTKVGQEVSQRVCEECIEKTSEFLGALKGGFLEVVKRCIRHSRVTFGLHEQ